MEKFNSNDLKYLAVELPQEVNLFKYAGDFEGEVACIDRWLKRPLFEALRKRLMLERIFAVGLQDDYSESAQEILDGIRVKYPDADEKTLDRIIESGNVDFIMKNGTRHFQSGALSNILNTHREELEKTAQTDIQPAGDRDTLLSDTWKIMREKGFRAFRYEVEEWMKIKPEYDRPGEKIRVWLPYPCECDTQYDIKLLESSHPVYISDSPIRTAMIETEHIPGTVYKVRFSYINRADYREIKTADISDIQPEMPEYTKEQYPHIRFTPTVCELAKELAGSEKNPLVLARRAYDWIIHNVRYSLMRDYLYMENIPEFVILNRYGDCGTMALVFITLCRYMGIPAKWQSGSYTRPDHIGSHDWAMFYIAPYGWLYCDPSFGNADTREQQDHYFGNLDPFRLVACNEFQIETEPAKKFLRMDPYDNQNGEAEYDNENVFFNSQIHGRSVISSEEIK